MSTRLLSLAGFALALALAGCATSPAPAAAGGSSAGASWAGAPMASVTFVVVRHAEKASEGGKDPTLAAAGEARAQALAVRLQGQPMRAAYATAYRRTQMTAMPTAQAHGLSVATYDANLAADAFAAQLRSAHMDGSVLVVGHSNTAPQIAAALCGCTVAPMDDTEFDRLMTVRFDAAGQAVLDVGRY
jgi:broad specificity phosphatase PhoE